MTRSAWPALPDGQTVFALHGRLRPYNRVPGRVRGSWSALSRRPCGGGVREFAGTYPSPCVGGEEFLDAVGIAVALLGDDLPDRVDDRRERQCAGEEALDAHLVGRVVYRGGAATGPAHVPGQRDGGKLPL